jgi:hypothetical protein
MSLAGPHVLARLCPLAARVEGCSVKRIPYLVVWSHSPKDLIPTMSSHLLVGSDAPTITTIHPCAGAVEPGDGQILVHVSKLLVTANTLTYAIAGKAPVLKYFDHFPIPKDAPTSLAMTPCWGTGVVIASKCAGVKEGTRIHVSERHNHFNSRWSLSLNLLSHFPFASFTGLHAILSYCDPHPR